METNVRCSWWVRVYMYGGRGEFTAFSDILVTISRRTYELEAFLRSGVCAAGSAVVGLDALECAEFDNGRHRRCGHGPERCHRSWRESQFEGRIEGQHARVHY